MKWDLRFLDLAKRVAQWSSDPSTRCGAVITDSLHRIISIGYNGLPRGVADTKERYENRELKLKMIVHAERNSLLFAKQDLTGFIIFTYPFMPCSVCAGMIIQSGIKRVVSYMSDNDRWAEDFKVSEQMFQEAGVELKLYWDAGCLREPHGN